MTRGLGGKGGRAFGAPSLYIQKRPVIPSEGSVLRTNTKKEYRVPLKYETQSPAYSQRDGPQNSRMAAMSLSERVLWLRFR
jgi:hypothetical protein